MTMVGDDDGDDDDDDADDDEGQEDDDFFWADIDTALCSPPAWPRWSLRKAADNAPLPSMTGSCRP